MERKSEEVMNDDSGESMVDGRSAIIRLGESEMER